MRKGTVKFFLESKGYGFIVDNDSQKEYFVHASGLLSEVQKDDEVEFEIAEGKKGENAINVRVV